MQAKAQKKYIRISPRKLRLVANAVKKLPPQEALAKLKFINKRGAGILAEVLKQAIDSAANTLKIDTEKLKFKEIVVNEGPRHKKRDKYHGARFDPGVIQKRTAHLRIALEEKGANRESKD